MYVIRHQAIRDYLNFILLRLGCQQPKIGGSIATIEKDTKAVIAALCNVVRHMRKDDSCPARHVRRLRKAGGCNFLIKRRKTFKMVSVPFLRKVSVPF